MAQIALFDLDGTLTWHDTLLPYLAGYLARHPARWPGVWRLPVAAVDYAAWHHDRGRLKSRAIQAVMGGESRARIDAWSEAYVANLQSRKVFRPAALATLTAHRAAGDHLVLLSASPDLYVPRIGQLLGFERTLCTELTWRTAPSGEVSLEGELRTANRRGEEKSACLTWLRSQYPDLPIVAYGNSDSDLPHLKLADRALLVNANAAAERQATHIGIAVAHWS